MRISDWSSDVCSSDLLIYILVHLGALLRVIAPLPPFDYMLVVAVAGGLWAAAFLRFLLVYAPLALRPSPEAGVCHPPGRPGRATRHVGAPLSVYCTTVASIPGPVFAPASRAPRATTT